MAPAPPVVQGPPAQAGEPVKEQPRKKPVFAERGFAGSMYDNHPKSAPAETRDSAIKKSQRSVGRRRRGSF